MKSKIWRILAIAMAAAMIACVSAGCSGNGNKDQSSAASSAASKTESSKEESKTESSAESEAESKDESEEESAADASEESEEASEEGSEEGGDTEEAALAGAYEYNVGDSYTGVILNEDGTLVYRNVNGFSLGGTWEYADGKLTMNVMGGSQAFTVEEGKIVADDDGNEMLAVDALSVEDNTDEILRQTVVSGTWQCTTAEGDAVSFTLSEDGTGTYVAQNGTEFLAKWDVESGVMNLHVEGGLTTFTVGLAPDTSFRLVENETGNVFTQVADE